MKRRQFIESSAAAAALAAGGAGRAAAQAPRVKTLRYAFPVAETGFDPAQISDLYSRQVTAHIFESPLTYDHLARPFKLKLMTAAEMPVLSENYTRCVVKIRPGIYFADDPVFKGANRELVAADYVYSWKRFFDPRWKAPYVASWMLYRFVGLNEYREQVLKSKGTFDYDREIEGLRVLDRYTFECRLAEPEPRFLYAMTMPDVAGAVAREVIEAYGDKIMEKPVGTGPFRLAEWRRS
ncbi:MAG: ABC transporter substrate-binding protein, partial [Burkholderiaceae bacterium]|nr:ABC transporter substrate-binding protein [Burkholderiaceae bacterium]